ncbi:histone deacetylase and transcriptional regulator [Scheffersomyces spartinae]|uniref:Histone deacetylase and transcriptional regulator n=1 Tax=Scheffersomyces spartinae TaxID=45513 RepID=A0A9P8AJ60_9ASCO|nr:histone deacetylase and transcriptional regulator [Scheffersomyces spartinae]KAG7194400.1 histone deacetylase and transcriptional regulator [Scheffersomyces spartinae]
MMKRDKRRQLIATRLNKLVQTFGNDRDNYYRAALHELQTTLATLQHGSNAEYLQNKVDLEVVRDYELTRLRLWEEYRVKRIETEYRQDIEQAKEQHDRMIKLIKEKLYDKLQRQIKQLKEDKLLLNLINANSWTTGNGKTDKLTTAAINAMVKDRRHLRNQEIRSRFTSGEADDLLDGGLSGDAHSGNSLSNGMSSNTGGYGNGLLGLSSNMNGSNSVNYNSAFSSSGYISASKRRRHYATRYSSNDELSSGVTTTTAANQTPIGYTKNGAGANSESNLSDKDYDQLNHLIMTNDDGGTSLNLLEKNQNNQPPKANTRGSSKQFLGPQGLKPEELNEDLALLRNAIGKQLK